MSSNQLAEHRDNHCWYAKVQQWFWSYGLSINASSLFQYRLVCPYVSMTRVVKNRVIRIDMIELDNGKTGIRPTTSLCREMAYYKAHFLYTLEDRFIFKLPNVVIHVPHTLFKLVKDWGRKIFMHTFGRKNLTIVSSGSGIERKLCFSLYYSLWNKREISLLI